MVAIVSGNTLGLSLTSLATLGDRGASGQSSLGRNGEQAWVNIANGNLVLQTRDEWGSSVGEDRSFVRTYNSQGRLIDGTGIPNDDNGDNWAVGIYKQQIRLTGTVNTAGSTVIRTGTDGAEAIYAWDAANSRYRSTAGDGAYDRITYAASEYVWTDGATGTVERYQSATGRLIARSDTNGNTTTFSYSGDGLLASTTDASGDVTHYDYTGNKLGSIRTVAGDGSTLTRVRYTYDAADRLASVIVDLSPDDGSIDTGSTYVTNYTYDGSSKRVASVVQPGGVRLDFTYIHDGTNHRVASISDGVGQYTTFAWDTAARSVIVSTNGQATTYTYDASGQLKSITGANAPSGGQAFEYNANGDLTRVIDGAGQATIYEYDSNGNRTLERDAAGNIVRRTFDERNQITSETVAAPGTPSTMPPSVTVTGYAPAPGSPITLTAHLSPPPATMQASSATVLTGVSLNNGVVTKTASTSAWDSSIRSTVGYANGARVAFTATSTTAVAAVGLSTWPTYTNDNNIPFSIQLNGTGGFAYYVDGQLIRPGSYVAGDTFGLMHDGSHIHFFKNGVLDLSWYRPESNLLYLDSSFQSPAATVSGLQFAAGTAAITPARITFRQGGTTLGTAAIVNDMAVLSTSITNLGTSPIDALYSGDLLNPSFASTAAPVRFGPEVAVTASSSQMQAAGDVTLAASLSGLNTLQSLTGLRAASGVAIRGNTVEKIGGVHRVWDGSVRSTTGYVGGASVSFTAEQSDGSMAAIGLTTDPAADNHRNSIDWALQVGSGTLLVFENGSQVANLGAYSLGDHLAVEYTGTHIRYLRNGVVLRQVETSITQALYLDSSFAGMGAKVGNLQFKKGAALAQPTGVVTFKSGTTVLGSVQTSSTSAQMGLSTLPTGAIRAEYSGDAYNAASTSPEATPALTYAAEKSSATTRYVYDAEGRNRLRFVVTAEGRVTEYVYKNADGTDPSRGQARSVIRYAGRFVMPEATEDYVLRESTLLAWTNTQDRTRIQRTDRTFDQWGHVKEEVHYSETHAISGEGKTDSPSSKTIYVYRSDGLLQQVKDPTDNTTTFVYDGLGNLVSTTNSLSQTTYYLQTYSGNTLAAQMANGLTRTSAYDANGRLASVTESKDGTTLGITRYTYNAANQLVCTEDATGVKQRVVYDSLGRKLAEIDGDGTTVEYTYDLAGRVARKYTYANRLSYFATAPNEITESGYYYGGYRPTTTPPVWTNAGHWDRAEWYAYDALGRLWKTVDAEGAVVEYSYDGSSRLVMERRYANQVSVSGFGSWVLGAYINPTPNDELDRVTRRFRDGDGLERAVLDAEGYLVEYQYDARGLLATTMHYTTPVPAALRATGTLAQMKGALPSDGYTLAVQLRNAKGQVVAEVDAERRVVKHEYDPAGRKVSSKRYAKALGPEVSLQPLPSTVNPQSQAAFGPSETADADRTEFWTYDALGRVSSWTDYRTTITSYTYDAAGNLAQTVVAAGGNVLRTQVARYDAQGRLVAELPDTAARKITPTSTQADIEGIWSSHQTVHTYDAAGRRTSTRNAAGDTTRYFYDADGRVVYSINSAGDVKASTYGALGQLMTERTTRIDGSTLVTLPPGGFATTAVASAIDSAYVPHRDRLVTYAYSARGDLTSRSETYGGDSAVFGGSATVYPALTLSTYNAFRETRDHVTRFYQPVGGGYLQEVTRSDYDRRGLLKATTVDPGAIEVRQTFERDAFGRVVTHTDAVGNQRVTRFDKVGREVEVFDGANLSHATTSQMPTRKTAYDAFDRVLKVFDAYGNETQYAYTFEENKGIEAVTITTPDMAASTTKVNRLGEVVETRSATGRRTLTATTFDASGERRVTVTETTSAGVERTLSSTLFDKLDRAYEVTDRSGVTTLLQYDQAGRLKTRIVDRSIPGGYQGLNLATTYDYDAEGRTVKTTEPTGKVTVYTWSQRGELLSQTVDPGGLNLTSTIQYDDAGRVVTQTDAAGVVRTYTYDAAGRRIREITDPGGLNITQQWAYDKAGNVTAWTDGAGQVTRYTYDGEGRVVHTIGAMGNVTRNWYDANGRLTRTTTYAKVIAASDLDTAGTNLPAVVAQRLVETPQEDETTYRVYDRNGRLSHTVNGLGEVERLRYDAAGHVTERTRFTNRVTVDGANAWVPGADPAPQPHASDERTRYFYNQLNQLTMTLDGTGSVTQFTYDASGAVLSRKTYVSTVTGDLTSELAVLAALQALQTSSLFVLERHQYDSAGRLVWTMDGTGAVTRFVRDAAGNVRREIQYAKVLDVASAVGAYDESGGTRVTDYAYDATNRLVFKVNAAGFVTKYQYDGAGKQLGEIQFATSIAAPTHGGSPYTVQSINAALPQTPAQLLANLRFRVMRYDSAGRLKYEANALGELTHYQYDGANRVLATIRYGNRVDLSGFVNSLATNAGTITPIYAPPPSADSRVTRTAYDAAGRAAYTVDAGGLVTSNTYDGAGRLITSTQHRNALDVANLSPLANYTAAQMASTVVPHAQDDRTTRWTYDAAGRIRKKTSADTSQEWYTYDGAGRRASYARQRVLTDTEAQAIKWTYTYDGAGRLLTETQPQVAVGTLAQSPMGALSYNSGGMQALVITHTYDGLGNLVSRSEGGIRTTSYGYDALGRQTRIVQTGVAVDSQTSAPEQSSLTGRGEVTKNLETVVIYDAFGQAVANKDAAGNRSYKTYDAAGRLRYEVDALGYVTSYERNALGDVERLTRHARKVNVVLGGGHDSPTTEQVAQWLAAQSAADQAANRVLQMSYDQAGRTTRVVQAAVSIYDTSVPEYLSPLSTGAPTTENTYNAFGEIVRERKLINAAQDTWAVTNHYFDRMGREEATVDAEGYLTRRIYNPSGTLASMTEYAGRVDGYSFYADAGFMPGWMRWPATHLNDRTTSFTYDAMGRVKTETRHNLVLSGGTSVPLVVTMATYDYDAIGNAVRVTDALGNETLSYFNAVGRVTATVRRPAGATTGTLTEYRYDVVGNATQVIEYQNGASVTPSNTYAAIGGIHNRITTTQYDTLGRAIQVTDANGSNSYMAYDEAGRLSRQWQGVQVQRMNDRTGTDTQVWWRAYRYDAVGQVVEVLEPNSPAVAPTTPTVSASFVSAARIEGSTSIGPEGQQARYFMMNGRNTVNLVWSDLVDETGDVFVQITYDTVSTLHPDSATPLEYQGTESQEKDRGQTFTASAAMGGVTLEWQDNSTSTGGISVLKRVTVKQLVGNEWVPLYDDVLNKDVPLPAEQNAADAGVASEVSQYNAFGELTATGTRVRKPNSDTTTWNVLNEYDQAGRLWRTNEGEGQARVYLYDGLGNRTAELRSAGIGRYNLNMMVFPDAATAAGMQDLRRTHYTYDRIGHVIKTVGPERQAFNDGRKIAGDVPDPSTYVPLGTRWQKPVITMEVDRWGNATRVSNPDALYTYTYYTYNADNKVLTVTTPSTSGSLGGTVAMTTIYTYDALGRQTAVRDARYQENRTVHDAWGRVTREEHADGGVIQHTYDALGNRLTTTDAMNKVTSFTYDRMGRLLSTVRNGAALATVDMNTLTSPVTTLAGTVTEAQEWDSLGRKVRVINGSGESTYYRYDLRGNVVGTEDGSGHVKRSVYDTQGRMVYQRDAAGMAASWRYDYFGRLLDHTDMGGARFSYTYDNAGQLFRQTNTRGQDLTYRYDAAGQLVRVEDRSVDAAKTASSGQPVKADLTTVYEYDLRGNRVFEITVRQDWVEQANAMSYDELGRLVRVDTKADFALPIKTDFSAEWYMAYNQTARNGYLGTANYSYYGQMLAGPWGMTPEQYAVWHYSNIGANQGIESGLAPTTEAMARAATPSERLAAISAYIVERWPSNYWAVAGAMINYKIKVSEAAAAVGLTETAFRQQIETAWMIPFALSTKSYDYEAWTYPGEYGQFGGVATGDTMLYTERGFSIRKLWQDDMAAPRLISTLMLRYRISLKETAHALGRSQQEIENFFSAAGLQPWEYDIRVTRVPDMTQQANIDRWHHITEVMRAKFQDLPNGIPGDPWGLAWWMRTYYISAEEIVAAAGYYANPADPFYKPGYSIEHFHQYMANQGVPQGYYDRSLQPIPDNEIYGPIQDSTQPIKERWDMLRNQWWNVFYKADPQAEGARYGAQVLAQGMLHAKISVQEMAAVGGISGDALRAYFAQHGIEPVNYDCAIMLAPGFDISYGLKAFKDQGDAERFTTRIAYDEVGNRQMIQTTGRLLQSVAGNPYGLAAAAGVDVATQTRYFQYDQMNRQTLVDGVAPGNSGTSGRSVTYDKNGNRTSDTFTDNGQTVTETYGYDSLNRLTTTTRSGGTAAGTEQRWYDAAGRVTRTTATNGPTNLYAYNADGTVREQAIVQAGGAADRVRYHTIGANPPAGAVLGYDHAGNLLGYELQKANGERLTYTYTYQRFESARQASIRMQSTPSGQSGQTAQLLGTTVMQYDANGHLMAVTDANTPKASRRFVNDTNGLTLASLQDGKITRQLVVGGEVLGRYSRERQDFNFAYQPAGAGYPANVPTSYTVTDADLADRSRTLQNIARATLGDARLWYWIAEANNLASAQELRAGQVLSIPNRMATAGNTADTFKPYDPSQIVGDTTPTLPAPGKKGCGGLGQVIMVVVAIVAAAVTQQWYLVQYAGGAAATGAQVVASYALGGAAGSIASQAVGLATGDVDRFSWKGVALSAIGAGVTAGLPVGDLLGTTQGSIANTVVRAALGSTITQGIGVATGLQKSFSWRSVAASAVGAGVGQVVGEAFGLTPQRIEGMSPGELFGKRLAKGLVAGTATALAKGGKVAIQQVAVDAFGNALGSSLAAQSSGPSGYSEAAQSAREDARDADVTRILNAGNATFTPEEHARARDWLFSSGAGPAAGASSFNKGGPEDGVIDFSKVKLLPGRLIDFGDGKLVAPDGTVHMRDGVLPVNIRDGQPVAPPKLISLDRQLTNIEEMAATASGMSMATGDVAEYRPTPVYAEPLIGEQALVSPEEMGGYTGHGALTSSWAQVNASLAASKTQVKDFIADRQLGSGLYVAAEVLYPGSGIEALLLAGSPVVGKAIGAGVAQLNKLPVLSASVGSLLSRSGTTASSRMATLTSPQRIARYEGHLQRLQASGYRDTEKLAEFSGRIEMLKRGYIAAGEGKLVGTTVNPGTGKGTQGIDRVYRSIADPEKLAVLESKYRTTFNPGKPLNELHDTLHGTQMTHSWLTRKIDQMRFGPHGARVNNLGRDLYLNGYEGRFMNVLDVKGRSYFYDLDLLGLK